MSDPTAVPAPSPAAPPAATPAPAAGVAVRVPGRAPAGAGRRPLPAIRVHRTLPPGAVPRPAAPVPPPRRPRWPLPMALAAVLAVVAVIGAVALTGGDGDRGGAPAGQTVEAGPRPVRLGAPPTAATADRAIPVARADLAVLPPLPAGAGRGAVFPYPRTPAPRAAVERLARTLGVPGPAVRDRTGWTVHAGTSTLRVADVSGWPWDLSTDADPPAEARGPGRRPSGTAVREASTATLTALGLGDAPVAYEPAGAGRVAAVARPAVGGLPTAGLETRLEYDTAPRLTGGLGWLARPVRGADYPLLPARAALEAAAASCAGCPRLRLTDPAAGLVLRWDPDGAALLVPAWLFRAADTGRLAAAAAVQPAYLEQVGPATRPDLPAIPVPSVVPTR